MNKKNTEFITLNILVFFRHVCDRTPLSDKPGEPSLGNVLSILKCVVNFKLCCDTSGAP